MAKKLLMLGAVFVLFANSWAAHAQETEDLDTQFTTNYEINYTVNPLGDTRVDQKIQIINKLKDVIASNYTLTVKQMVLTDILARDQKGSMDTEISEEDDQTTIKARFNDASIGEGKVNEVTISYNTGDIANKIGEVWNVNIPKVNLLDLTEDYDVTLTVPTAFGPEIFISPQPTEKIEEATRTIYKFNRESLENTGISGSFGNYQVMNFMMEYDLENDSQFPAYHEIALPPDIPNIQQVSYKSIEPAPTKIKIDGDGNTIAVYKIGRKDDLTVYLIGTARILGQQIKPQYGLGADKIPNELVRKYTKPTQYWNSNDPRIEEIARELYNPEKSASENAQNAYFFVVNNLDYDYNILDGSYTERIGGMDSLNASEKVGCMEFTDLFISIVRAMGIPARELNGYAITQDTAEKTPVSINLRGGDLLHSWAEYYDEEFGWVPVDPTWGDTSGQDYFTKLDTNHLAFVVKGIDPELPLPAGAYKSDEGKKQVEVGLAGDVDENSFVPKLKLYKHVNVNLLKTILAQRKYYLKNEGQTTVYFLKNDGRVALPPQTYESIYLDIDDLSVNVVDATGQQQILSFSEPDEYLNSPLPTCITLGILVLGLCTIVYLLIIRPKGRKTLLGRLRRHLPGQGQ